MSQPPLPGRYLDSCQTTYHATLNKKTGWWLQRIPPGPGAPPEPFQQPDFPAACNAQIFVFQSVIHDPL